ncbi:MAG: aminopeptidase P family protein [Anaerolineae bacterium]|nr:aminopeptidase P family protein [Anaerolineae bacterium]
MADKPRLVQEKLDQAVAILDEQGIDAWMIFVRETMLSPDPCLDLILGMDVVWQSAFIITRDNQRIAIVGHHDAENVRNVGGYTNVIPYVEGIRNPLIDTLLNLNPMQLALNYSEDDAASDGLGHGLMLLLQRYLADADLVERMVSSEQVVVALRGCKSQTEVKHIRDAIATTQAIFREIGKVIKPGVNERAIAQHIHKLIGKKGLDTAWDRAFCPTVNIGPDSPVGHGGPQAEYAIKPGMLVHIDFGVRQDDYCADLQRVWYVRQDKEQSAPEPVKKAFDAARHALLAGFDALKPGVEGWQVDEAARQSLVKEGYSEYQHAFGHHLGRSAHDGSTILGPRWERYGQTPYGIIEPGNVFAIEQGVAVEDFGYVGLEENILVTESGAMWLSDPQTELWMI